MTSTVNFKIDSKLKSEAQKTAEDLGLTLTSVMSNYLSDFVQEKSVSFNKLNHKFVDPFGSMPGKPISEKEIKSFSLAWQKRIQKIG